MRLFAFTIFLVIVITLVWSPISLIYEWTNINPLSREIPRRLIDETQRYRPLIGRINPRFGDLIESLPQILGYENKQHYIVLLQNNMELRPTG
jgi:hypothetical protein